MDAAMIQDGVDKAFTTGAELISVWGIRVLGAIGVIIVGRIIAGLVHGGARRSLARGSIDPSVTPFIASLAKYGVLAVVLIAALSLLGIETTSLVAVVGAAGLAIGLALQGTLSNFSSGVMLLVFRPIRQGDYVEIGGQGGTVVEIGVFSTLLNTPDNVRVTMPNGNVYGAVIKNYSFNENRRIDLVMGVHYDDDIDTAMEICRKVCQADERVLADPATTIAVSELGDSSVNFVVRPWCKGSDYWPLRFELIRKMKLELEAGGCTIPYPQRDVHTYPAGANGSGPTAAVG